MSIGHLHLICSNPSSQFPQKKTHPGRMCLFVVITQFRYSSTNEMEGFDSIMVSSPSSRERATVHRTVAFKLFKSLHLFPSKKTHPGGVCLFWRRWRDLNPRTPCGAWRISNPHPSATWVHLLIGKLPYYISGKPKNQGFSGCFFASSMTSPILAQISL